MIQSMTGYGRSVSGTEKKRLIAEIRAVNHRYCEVQVRIPKKYGAFEEKLRLSLSEALDRGKVELYIKSEGTDGEAAALHVDTELAARYNEKIRELAQALDIPMNYGVSELISLPGILVPEEQEEEPDEVWARLSEVTQAALAQLIAMRKAEGERLTADFTRRLDCLEALRRDLAAYAPRVAENYRKRLFSRIEELMGQQPADEGRLIQEVAMFAEKAAIDEELVRLDSHFKQFLQLIGEDEPVGRKLDFLCQEIHREVNTAGAKANDPDMTRTVVEMKSELEKLREQVQNIR